MLDLILIALGRSLPAGSIAYPLTPATVSRRQPWSSITGWLGIVTAGLLVYLTYALLKPEKF